LTTEEILKLSKTDEDEIEFADHLFQDSSNFAMEWKKEGLYVPLVLVSDLHRCIAKFAVETAQIQRRERWHSCRKPTKSVGLPPPPSLSLINSLQSDSLG
jgi:hypothetical protein